MITPSGADPLLTALASAASSGAKLTLAIGIRSGSVWGDPADNGRTVIVRPAHGEPAVYALTTATHYQSCRDAGLSIDERDFSLCATVTVQRDPSRRDTLTASDRNALGDNVFRLNDLPVITSHTPSSSSVPQATAAPTSIDFSDLSPVDASAYTANGQSSLAGTRFQTADGTIGCLFSPQQRWCTTGPQVHPAWRSADLCSGGLTRDPAQSSALGWLAWKGPACHWHYESKYFLSQIDGTWDPPLATLPVGSRITIPMDFTPNTSDTIECGSRTTGLTCVHSTDSSGFTIDATGAYRTF